MRLLNKKLSVLMVFAMVLVTGRVCAEDVTAVRLHYSASRGCANERGFFEQITARTQRVRLADVSEPATALVVSIRDVPGGLAGRFELRGDEGTTSAREVKAASCDQVVAALAIMAALAIDPDASTEPLADPKPEAAPQPAPLKPVTRPEATPSIPAAAGALRSRGKAGVSLAVLAGVFDEPVLAVRPFLELAREGRSPWGYTLRLSAARFQRRVSRAEGTGEFSLYLGRIEGCPAHFRPFAVIWISACLIVEGGWLEARGADVTPQKAVTRGWLAAGETTRIELRLLEILSLEASGEVFFPIVRDRFFVGNDATVHQTPAVGGGASMGLAVLFP